MPSAVNANDMVGLPCCDNGAVREVGYYQMLYPHACSQAYQFSQNAVFQTDRATFLITRSLSSLLQKYFRIRGPEDMVQLIRLKDHPVYHTGLLGLRCSKWWSLLDWFF